MRLIFLAGSNPLPNYIVTKLLSPKQVVLLWTPETGNYATFLESVVRNRLGIDVDKRFIEDASLQRVVAATITPALNLFLEASSPAYRKGLGRHRTAQRVRQAFRDGDRWALSANFHHFFDSIGHAALENRLDAYLADPPLVRLIMQWVRTGAPAENQGIPTGSPIAPPFAKLFLDSFDESLEAQGARLARYADDFLVLFKNREETEQLYDSVLRLARWRHMM